jgi:hypothetical protein
MAKTNTTHSLAGDSRAMADGHGPYAAPAIIALGTLADLTEGTDPSTSDDAYAMGGSHPAGY